MKKTEPTIFMMIGIQGSGKSTKAKQIAEEHNAVIVSSDDIREEIYGNAINQSNPKRVFAIFYERAHEAINCGRNVILDATNIYKRDRANAFREFPSNDICAVFVDVPLDECIRRNAERERHVPEEAIRKYHNRMELPTMEEGFKEIIKV